MYCSNCGAQMTDEASFCKSCGAALSKNVEENQCDSSRLIGYSLKINDPAFTKYKSKSSKTAIIFSLILAAIAVVAFPIYGNVSGEMDFPASLLYGLGIGGMFVVIALLQILKKSKDKDWDGVVLYKDVRKEIDNRQNGGVHYRTVYILKVKKDSGSVKKHKWYDTPGLYNYYNIDDRVRHHKGFYFYEKYDKSRDTHIMCAACMSMNDIKMDVCPKCKCPLLK